MIELCVGIGALVLLCMVSWEMGPIVRAALQDMGIIARD